MISLKSIDLTAYQLGLWLDCELTPDSRKYNLPFIYKINGRLNVSLVRQAWNKVVEKHRCLRTIFTKNKHGKTKLCLLDKCETSIKYVEAKNFFVNKEIIKENKLEIGNKVFKLDEYPLWAITVLKVEKEQYYIMFNFHHLMIDGSSVNIIFEDLSNHYNNSSKLLKQKEDGLIKYLDWQKDLISSPIYSNADKFYTKYLCGVSLSNNFPRHDFNNDAKHSGRIRFLLNKDIEVKIKELVEKNNSTMFCFMVASLSLLLNKYFGFADVVIGHPTGKRPERFNGAAGFFVNTSFLKIKINQEKGLLDLLTSVTNDRKNKAKFDFFPYGDIIKLYRKVNSNVASTEQINTLVSPTSFGHDRLKLHGTKICSEFIDANIETQKDFILFYDFYSKPEILFEYNPKLFPKHLAEGLKNSFKHLVEQFLEEPNRKIKNVGATTPHEKELIIKNFSGKPSLYPITKCLHEFVEYWSDHTPNAIALDFYDKKTSYFELNFLANMIGKALIDSGIVHGDRVGLFCSKSVEVFASIIALFKIGAVFVPIDADYPQARIKHILNAVNAKKVLSMLFSSEIIVKLGIRDVIYIDSLIEKNDLSDIPNIVSKTSITDLAYIVFTSGTTGYPKGVMIEHRSLTNFAISQSAALQVDNASKVLQFASLSFDTSMAEWAVAFVSGSTACVPGTYREIVAAEIGHVCNKFKISHAIMTPSLIETIDKKSLTTLKCLVSAGEPCSKEIINTWSTKLKLFNACGPTETTVGTHLYLTNYNDKPTVVGKPLCGVYTYILDGNNIIQPIGAVGEICVGGIGVARGYLDDPILTDKKFISICVEPGKEVRVYKSGDIGRLLPNGYMEIFGRNDDQIKIRGYRVELSEIKKTLQNHPCIARAEIVVKKNISNNKYLVGYITTCKNKLSSEDVKRHLTNFLPKHMVPSFIVFLDKIPMTEHGKVDKTRLPDPCFEKQASYEKRSVLEKKLIDIWENLLGFRVSDIDSSFFDLGGDSLLTTRLALEVEKFFGLKISLAEFFVNPTIKELVTKIEGRKEPECVGLGNIKKDIADFTKLISLYTYSHKTKELEKKDVLITGTTGFLGAHLLYELLQKNIGKIYCLIRADNYSLAYDRLLYNMQKYYAVDALSLSKIEIVVGDVGEENFGLSTAAYESLSQKIDVIYHCAAQVNHIYNYDVLRKINVLGTLEIIKFGTNGKLKTVNYISALSGINDYDQEGFILEELPESKVPKITNGYGQTKWVSELLLKEASLRGMSINIFRPGTIIGNIDKDFSFVNNDHFVMFIKGCIQMGVTPDWFPDVIALPVDIVSSFIVKASLKRSSYGNVFNIVAPKSIRWADVLMLLQSLGFVLNTISIKKWVRTLSHEKLENNSLYPLLSLYINNQKLINKEMGYKINKNSCRKTISFAKKINVPLPINPFVCVEDFIKYLNSKRYFCT